MTNPTLFLDVDGVVSPFPSRVSKAWPDWKQIPYSFNLELSKQQAAALMNLPVDITWLTTWENLANQVISKYFEWPELPVIHSENHRWGLGSLGWWKYDAIITHMKQGGGPFIWADDDIEAFINTHHEIREDGTYGVLDEIKEYKVPFLIVPTKTTEGLTPGHIEMIKNWCIETGSS